jgi:hypothetical protein
MNNFARLSKPFQHWFGLPGQTDPQNSSIAAGWTMQASLMTRPGIGDGRR